MLNSASFPRLGTESFTAFIADNSKLGIHLAGYNGVASLVPKHSGNNLFVPIFAGLNLEFSWPKGLAEYRDPTTGRTFEPRCEPMSIEMADKNTVILAQPETSHAHVSSRIIFTVEEPYYLHQQIEMTMYQRHCGKGEKQEFKGLFASYMHMPPDIHVYLKTDQSSAPLKGWVGITREEDDWLITPLPDDRELTAGEHLAWMESTKPEKEPVDKHTRKQPLAFYYGICHDDLMVLNMFKQPDRFRIAYNPVGGGPKNPAWDYIAYEEDMEIGKKYIWDMCLAIKGYKGREDVLEEVNKYRKGP
jgi:hypothetical protein